MATWGTPVRTLLNNVYDDSTSINVKIYPTALNLGVTYANTRLPN